jgi:hypothetical protein
MVVDEGLMNAAVTPQHLAKEEDLSRRVTWALPGDELDGSRRW